MDLNNYGSDGLINKSSSCDFMTKGERKRKRIIQAGEEGQMEEEYNDGEWVRMGGV